MQKTPPNCKVGLGEMFLVVCNQYPLKIIGDFSAKQDFVQKLLIRRIEFEVKKKSGTFEPLFAIL